MAGAGAGAGAGPNALHQSGAITWHDVSEPNFRPPDFIPGPLPVVTQDDSASQCDPEDEEEEGRQQVPPSEAFSTIPESEMRNIYKEATAFEGAAVVTMIERENEDDPDCAPQTALEITMEDGVTLTVELDSGEKRLNDLGYTQELQRVLTFFQVYCFAITTITVFAGVVPMYAQGYINGGPVALVWYWWIGVFFVHLVGLSFAEIASSLPLAGSLYFWAAAMAPPNLGPVCSFFTGWLEFLGPACGLASVASNGAGILQTLIFMCSGTVITRDTVYGLSSAVILINGGLNLLPMQYQSYIYVFSGIFQLLVGAVLVVMLPLVAPATQPASYVFGEFYSPPDINMAPSQAYSVVLALQVSQFSLYGYDGVCHLAEETKQSDRTAPIAIMGSISTMSVVGWLIIVSATFSIQNTDSLVVNGAPDANGNAFLQILWDAFFLRYGSGLGAQIFTGFIFSSFFFGCMLGMVAASRVCFSLARDNGFPFSHIFRRVNPTTRMPVYAIILVTCLGLLFLLPLLGSNAIFMGVTSLQSIAWVGAYSVPIFFRLVQKEKDFCPGPFYMADYIGVTGGKLVHGVALLWVLYTVASFMLPYAFPVTAQNLNWAPVALAMCLAILSVWWVLDARFWFVGPKVTAHEVDRVPILDDEQVEFFETQKDNEVEFDANKEDMVI